MCLYSIFRNEELFRDFSIAKALRDQVQDLKLTCRYPEGLLLCGVRCKRLETGPFRGDKHFLYYDFFADGFVSSRDPLAQPDPKRRKQDCDKRAVELNRMLDDDKTVFGILEGNNQ